jgi:hypothetical protein
MRQVAKVEPCVVADHRFSDDKRRTGSQHEAAECLAVIGYEHRR